MEELLDIFRGDAFSVTTLERVAPNIPYVPQALGQMGLFNDKPIRTRTVQLYMDNQEIKLVPTSEIGSPESLPQRYNGELVSLKLTALRQRDRIMAEELTDVASINNPSNALLRSVLEEVNDRSSILRQNNELTMEHMRLGALQGKIIDADGTTVVRNYFTEFGVAEPVAISFNFATIAEADLVDFIDVNIIRPMIRALKGRATTQTRVGCLVGDTFWSKLRRHPAYRELFRGTDAMAAQFSKNQAWGMLDFAGVMWINYRGTDTSEISVGTNDALFFPINAMNVFSTFWGPGETLRDRGTRGKPVYMLVRPDTRDEPEWIDLHVRSYPLFACIYPKCLMKGVAV